MTHPLVVVSVIAFLLVAGVAAMVLHDLRGRAVQRVQKSLHHLARQGEAILSLPESDIRRACLWGAQAREQVRALLSRAAADDFEHTISTLLAGAEMLDYYGRKRGGSDAARPRELDWVSSIRDGVAWLRRRTPLLAASEIRGPLRWVRP